MGNGVNHDSSQNVGVNSGITTTDGSQPFDIASMFANNK